MKVLYLFLLLCCVLSCTDKKTSSVSTDSTKNISKALLLDLAWLNEPTSFEISDSSLLVTVDMGTDFFNNPEDQSVVGTAPYLHKSQKGDFVARVLVQPDFTSQWNAVALMVHLDSINWIKFAFENSDATGPSVVSVVTKGTSDDANGVALPKQQKVWLAIAKKGNNYSMHWSTDGKGYKMARLTQLPDATEVGIGMEFQSPVGDQAQHLVHFFEVEERTVENLRALDLM